MVGVLANALERLRLDPPPLDNIASVEFLAEHAPSMINETGTAPEEVLRVFTEVLAPAVISVDSPRYFSFIPTVPTKASLLFDLVVSAGSLNGISWLDASGAVWAENQALRFLSDLCGLPPAAGGCFVAGGSAANLSALAVARDVHRHQHPEILGQRRLLVGAGSHSSVYNTARLLDMGIVAVETSDASGRLTAGAIANAIAADPDPATICAISATAGATNTGVVDDLAHVFQSAQVLAGIEVAGAVQRRLSGGAKHHRDAVVVGRQQVHSAGADDREALARMPDFSRAAEVRHRTQPLLCRHRARRLGHHRSA